MTVKPRYAKESPDYRVALDPFTRKNWITESSRGKWRPQLGRFARAKDEAEWRSVMSDETDRKAAIIHVTNQTRETWLRRLSDHDLHFREIRYSKKYDGFAHEFKPTDKSNPERLTYSVVAQNPDVADKMKEAELEMEGEKRHRVVGELLGFPDCCIDHFAENWLGNASAHLTDPMYEAACATDSATESPDRENILLESPEAYTNTMWRYFGWSFLTHMPCSFECEKSREIGEARHRIMEKAGYGEAAEAGLEWLRTPFVWSAYKSIGTIRNEHVIGEFETSSYWSKKRVYWKERPSSFQNTC